MSATVVKIDRRSVRRNGRHRATSITAAMETMERDPESSYHLWIPIGPYDYGYRSTNVTCRHCQATFSHKRLLFNVIWPSENRHCADRVCPECNQPWCCELEYEKLTNAELERLAKRNGAARERRLKARAAK